MKTAYRMIIPSRPEPGHSGCNQCRNISALLMCFGSFVESCIYSWLHSGHFMWNCFLESFFFIVDPQMSPHNNYIISQRTTINETGEGISENIPATLSKVRN